MGMYDKLYDADGTEWQTKAFDRELEQYHIGSRMPGGPVSYQVEIKGGRGTGYTESLATIHAGVLVEVDAERDPLLILIGYYGRIS